MRNDAERKDAGAECPGIMAGNAGGAAKRRQSTHEMEPEKHGGKETGVTQLRGSRYVHLPKSVRLPGEFIRACP